ncbi:hypothetical protein M1N80_00690 [Peptococcaceae bacterium]|nr:hypothetical protein [Peptococcaceae bacterium]
MLGFSPAFNIRITSISAHVVSKEVRHGMPCSTAALRILKPSRSCVLPLVRVFITK